MKTITLTDRATYQITAREWTDQGYLRVPGTVARTGIQQYLAKELGLTDRKPDAIVNVYRPPEEVFNTESLDSYEDVDVTDDHPDDLVDAKSYKRHAVGHTTDKARQEGDHVIVDMIIKDAGAIEAVENGKASLSAGYKAKYEYEPGQTEDGTPYEFVQRDIRINHVALVGKARAGAAARLHDHDTSGGKIMTQVTLDGQTVEVEDKATAQLIQHAFDASKNSYKDMENKAKEMEDEAAKLREKMEEMEASRDKAIEDRDKYAEAANDEAIAEKIKQVSDAKAKAVDIAGDAFTCDSVDVATIQREALKTARPTVDWDNKSESYVQAAWDLEAERTTGDRAADSHARFSQDLASMHHNRDGNNEGLKAYDAFLSGKTEH